MRISCPTCKLDLRVKKNSVGVESMADFGSYQYFHADLWKCPVCGLEVVTGFGSTPIAEYYMQPKYEQAIAADKAFGAPVFQVWANQREKDAYLAQSRVSE
jgi:hypothetical protein